MTFWQASKRVADRCWEILRYSAIDFFLDEGPHWAAAIAFYGMLSIFPLMVAAVAITGLFVDPHWATERASNLLGDFLPQGKQTIRTIVANALSNGGRTGFFSVIILLITGTRVFSALIRSLNVAYGVGETYNLWKRLLVQFAMLFTAGLFFAAAILTDLAGSLLRHLLHSFPEESHFLLKAFGELLPAALLIGGFFCLYRFVPRNRSNWKSALLGAVAAGVSLLAARSLFAEYVTRLARYGEVYGWLAIGMVLLLWAYIAGIITVFCGEIVSHTQMIIFDGVSGQQIEKRRSRRFTDAKLRSTPDCATASKG